MNRMLFMVLVLGGLVVPLQAATILHLKNSVEVSSRDVLLGDLVLDTKLIPVDWAKRKVFAAPPAGEVAYRSLTAVAHGLAHYDDMERVTLSGEPVISILRRDRRVEKEEFYKPIREYLENTEPWKGNDLDVNIISIPRNTRVPAGKSSYLISQIDQKTSKGYSLAYVSVLTDGEVAAEVPVGIEIKFMSEVWVTTRKLDRGDIISIDDLRKELHVVDATSNYISCKEDIVGYEVTRPLSAGALLRSNAISKPMCAKRGDWVAITALGKNLHITLRAKAMSNGRLGDRIMCVNERSQRQVMVELTGSGSGKLVRL